MTITNGTIAYLLSFPTLKSLDDIGVVELAQARAGGRPMTADSDRGGIRVVEKELPPVPIWDPEVLGEDAMPSPFLKRDIKIIKGLRWY